MLYNGAEKKTPLAGVFLSAYGSTSTISDQNGNFALTFRVLHEGDKVNVRRMEKAGYEVFNTEALEQWYITRSNLTYDVVLCETATLNRLKDKYREAATQASTDRLIKEENREKEQQQKGLITEEEYEKRIDRLETEHEKQLDKIDTYVDRIARIDLSTLDKEEKQIIDLIEQGRFDEAIAAYDKLQLVEKYRTERASIQRLAEAKKEIEKAQSEHESTAATLFESAYRQVNLLRLIGGQENIVKAREILQNLYWADSTQVRPAILLAMFHIDHHDYQESNHVLTAVLPHCKNWMETVRVKSLMASLQTIWREYAASQTLLLECLELCKQNMTDDEESSLSPLRACYDTYYTMAANSFQLDQDSLTDAYSLQALSTAERIFAIDSTRIKMLAKVNFSRGNFLFAFKRYEESSLYLEKCLSLYATQPEAQVDIQTRARCKGILATVLTHLGQKDRALALTQESIQDIELLYKRNPIAHIYDLALSKYQAATVAGTYGDKEKYIEYIDGSIALFEQMAKKNPKAFNRVIEQLKQERDEGLQAIDKAKE